MLCSAEEENEARDDGKAVSVEDGREDLLPEAEKEYGLARAQYLVRKHMPADSGSMVDSLIADRRAESARQDGEHLQWVARQKAGDAGE